MKTNQMNGLYPIIRRVRRPLLPVDWPADAKPANVPVSVSKEKQPGQQHENNQKSEKHGEITTSKPAK